MTSDNQRAAAPSALDDVRVEVSAQLADQQLVAFPDIPEGGPEANWPGGDWVAFLDVAVRLGCKVIHTNTETLDKEEVDAVEEALDAALTRLETLADPEDDLAERRALLRRLQSLIADIKVHNGDVGRIELAFADHGVVHRWERKTAWWDDFHSADVDNLLDEVESPLATVTGWRDRREEQQTELSRLEPRIAELIAEVLAVPGFLAGRSQRARRVAAQDAVGELGEWCRLGHDDEDPLNWARRRGAWQVLREAECPRTTSCVGRGTT